MKRFSLYTLGVVLACTVISASIVRAQKNSKEIVRRQVIRRPR
jgi:hypothetical protein